MNHFAHSEASKAAKTTEANLKNKIDEVEAHKQQAETELRKCVNYLRLRKENFADLFLLLTDSSFRQVSQFSCTALT
jgi:hypothetical protein